MHRVVPQLIVDNYRAGVYRGQFPAVGMFLDLSGFSTMTDALMQHGQHGAEVLAGLMHSVFGPLVERVFEFGGKIVGFAGDGVMALYPVDSDARATALRALTSAHLIQKRFDEQPTRQTSYGTFSVTAKIGLASGDVSWGILRSTDGSQATYYFRGTAVDDSAEAEHHARAGEILLTDPAWHLLQGSVDISDVGRFKKFHNFRSRMASASPVFSFPAIDREVSHLFLPDEVIAYDVRGEFRQIVNLFMRFPNLSEAQLAALMAQVFELRLKYGGLLTRLDFGDKGCNLLILWGAPVAYENDIIRALNFLLDLKERVPFPITSGVTYYIAHAGYLGSVMCEDYTCYGWGVNLASRFMMNAPSGETWVDDRIARRVASRFHTEFLGSQHFKGFAAEQKVHRLGGQKQLQGPIYHGELVGRQVELARLARFVEPLRESRFAGLALISGDAGVGKGHLVYEFRSGSAFEGKRVLWAVCLSDQILRQSFNPLRDWLRQYFGVVPERPVEEQKRSFTIRLDRLLDSISDPEVRRELSRTRSCLGALLELRWEDSLYEQLDAEGRYNNTMLALIVLFKAESLRQPVVLFFEDLQFMDHDSREFLLRLKRSLRATGEAYPLAIIVTTRPLDSALPEDLVDVHLRLNGISLESVAHLAETMLGGAVAPSLVSLLWKRSEGNPYFAEQILRYLQEENSIEMSRDGWSLVSRLREDFVPGDIRSILVARLDQLAREVRMSIQTASVLGREFELRVLLAMLRDDERVPAYVAEAEKAAIWAPLDELRYIFSHALLRDAAYSMQMLARLQELHALAVETFESLYPDDLRSHYAELAYHADHAGLLAKARHYYTLAGKNSSDLYQNSQAIDYFTRALALTASDGLEAQFSLLLERVDLYNRLADRASQLRDLQALESLAVQLRDIQRQARVNMLLAHYHISVGAYGEVLRYSERVLALTQEAPDMAVLLDTYRVWPLALLRLGRLEEAMEAAMEGRMLARSHGDPVKEGYILNAMGLIAIDQNDPAAGQQYLEQALSLAREAGDRRLEAMTLGNMGTSAANARQDFDAAREYLEACLRVMHERGERSSEAVSLNNLGWAAGLQGDFEAARAYYERAVLLARESGNVYSETNTLINLSAATGSLGQAENAIAHGQKGLELSRRAGDPGGQAWALHYMGYGYLLAGHLEQAETAFRQAAAIREELGQPGMNLEPLAGLIQTLLANGDVHAALRETEKVIAYLQEGGTLDGAEEPLRIYYACYLTLAQAQDARASTVLRTAAELIEVQLAKLRDERSRRVYVENVPWRLALWQAWQARAT